MALGSLANISVQNGSGNGAMLMPKLQYRFRVILDGFGAGGGDLAELTKQVVDVTRPNLSFENMELHTYNSKSHLAGKHTWQPVTLTLREDASNIVQKMIGQQLQKQFDFANQSSAATGQDYKFQLSIEILDGGNGAGDTAGVLERWECYGCFIVSANYNTLNYAESAPVTTTLEIQYDNAVQITVGVGNGDRGDGGTSVSG